MLIVSVLPTESLNSNSWDAPFRRWIVLYTHDLVLQDRSPEDRFRRIALLPVNRTTSQHQTEEVQEDPQPRQPRRNDITQGVHPSAIVNFPAKQCRWRGAKAQVRTAISDQIDGMEGSRVA